MQHRILVIEDDNICNKLIREIISDEHQLKILTTGLEVIEVINQFQPHLILLDINLPDIDGYSICKKVKSTPGFETIRIVMMSASAMHNDIQKGFEVGADDYLTKPFDPAQLQHTIEKFLTG